MCELVCAHVNAHLQVCNECACTKIDLYMKQISSIFYVAVQFSNDKGLHFGELGFFLSVNLAMLERLNSAGVVDSSPACHHTIMIIIT